MEYFFKHGLVDDDPEEIARFFHCTSKLSAQQMRRYLDKQ